MNVERWLSDKRYQRFHRRFVVGSAPSSSSGRLSPLGHVHCGPTDLPQRSSRRRGSSTTSYLPSFALQARCPLSDRFLQSLFDADLRQLRSHGVCEAALGCCSLP